jgi:type VI secretion system protein ImpL
MKRLFAWLFKPWLLALLGVLMLSLILWFEGPLLAFDGREPLAQESVRWMLIGLLLLAWAAYFGWKWVSARLANRRLAEGLAVSAAPGEKEAAEEISVLRERMQQAVEVLRETGARGKRGFASRGQYLYQLPWYLFVGVPGCGKTTALMRSGMHFPLAEKLGQGSVGGIGGTRNCDWWFTDEAVLLDTAGRYITQDSDKDADRNAWLGFLDLLKKYRPRSPINGVIVAVSVEDLLEPDRNERQAQAVTIRERIAELHQRLGIQFPVYVMLTKCDLLPGFSEYFERFDQEQRAQVWGCTFPLAKDGGASEALAVFPTEFQGLERQLQGRLLERMQEERDLRRRGLLYGLPQQFASLAAPLAEMLAGIFQPSRYAPATQLRGVYLTSGTQLGTPIDRVMSSLASAFGLPRQALQQNRDSGRSYFVTRMLRDLVFPEAGLAGLNLHLERRRLLMQRVTIGAAVALTLLVAVGMTISYFRNQSYVAEVARRSDDLARSINTAPSRVDPVALLPVLEAARSVAGEHDGVPLLNRFGLYQGEKMGAGADLAYRRLLRDTLLPTLQARLETVLRRGEANNPEALYELLRLYLMLGDRRHFDSESVQTWADLDWVRNLVNISEAQRQQLSRHVASLLDDYSKGAEPVRLDNLLISQTRLSLARLPLAKRVYNRVKRDLAHAGLPEFSVASAVGADVSGVLVRASGEPLTRGIPGTHTIAGYRKFLGLMDDATAETVRDNWILDRNEGDVANPAQMAASVRQLYFEDYIRQWDQLLGDVRVAPFSTLDQAARISTSLSGEDSPLRKFLQAAARETTLETAPASAGGTAGAAVDAAKGKINAAKKKLESVFGGAASEPASVTTAPGNAVDQHFDALHKLVGAPGAGQRTPLDQALSTLKDATLYFDAAEGAHRSGAPPPPPDALNRLKREAEGKPAPLVTVMQGVKAGAEGLTLGNERARLNALWSAAAAPFCRQAIAGRYPLVRGGAREITADDFGKFFGPNGMVDDFFQKNLANRVDMSGPQWRWRAGGDASLGMSQDVLNEFQRAAKLRDMFFAGGGRQPSLRFDLKPVAAEPGLTRVLLEIDGQAVNYASDAAATATTVQLPSGKGSGLVRFQVEPPSAQTVPSTEGPWAWLHMMDRGQLEGGQSERYRLTFDLGGRRINYELIASSVVNPFRRDALQPFHCMEKL